MRACPWRRGLALWPPFILVALALVGCEPAVPPEAKAFASRYAILHREGDIEGLAALVAWGDSPIETRTQFLRAMAEETRWPIQSIRIHEAGPGEIEDHFGTGAPPPGPIYRLVVRLDTGDGFGSTWLVGEAVEGDGLRLLLQPIRPAGT